MQQKESFKSQYDANAACPQADRCVVLIGNRKWIREKNFIEIPADVENKLQAQEQLGHTAILVAVDGKEGHPCPRPMPRF